MADSLDDFFAKKDKKRSKDKGKSVVSAETLVRELEEGAKQVEYPSRKENKTSTAIELLGLDADDADWKDFEDVEKRDYSGLKVKEMSLQDQNEEEQRRLTSEQTETLPESTPWKIKDDQTSLSATPAATATTTPTAATTLAAAAAKAAAATTTSTDSSSTSAKSNKDIEMATKSGGEPDASSSSEKPKSTTTDEQQQNIGGGGESAKDGSKDSTQTSDKESAKPQKYVPPSQRGLAGGEVKILEPMKLSKTKASGSRHGASIPNIQDESAFPSLG